MRGCHRARRDVLRAVDQSLSLEERFRLDAHLERCAGCRSLLARAQALEELLVDRPEPGVERVDVERSLARIRAELRGRDAGGELVPGLGDEPSGAPDRTAEGPIHGARVLRFVALAVAVLAVALFASRFVVSESPSATDESGSRFGSPELADATDPPASAAGMPEESLEVSRAVDREGAPSGPPRSSTEAFESSPPATPAEVRVELARWLVEVVGPHVEDPLPPRLLEEARFEERLADWPLVRLAEDLLRDDDPRVARAAARYIGRRGDRVSASRLGAARGREEIAGAVVRALGDLGEPGVPALQAALSEPRDWELALASLVGQGSRAAARAVASTLTAMLEGAARSDARPTVDRSRRVDACWLALEDLAPASVASLLLLASGAPRHDPGRRVKALNRLARAEGGAGELVRLVGPIEGSLLGFADAELEPVGEGLLLEAAGRLMPEALLPWVADRAADHRTRALALRVLGNWRGTAPVATLLELDASGRLPEQDLVAAMRRLAAGGEARLRAFALSSVEDADALTLERYLALLVASEHPSACGALVELARADALAEDQRQWAALAVGELGEARHGRMLLATVARGILAPEVPRRFLAACLLAIQSLLGDEGAHEALLPLSDPARRLVIDALPVVQPPAPRNFERAPELEPRVPGERGAVDLFRVARALGQARAFAPEQLID